MSIWDPVKVSSMIFERVSYVLHQRFHCFPLANPMTFRLAEVAASQEQALGMVSTFRGIVREEGPRGLYRGLLPNFLKVIPAVSIGYVVYEQAKQLLGVESIK